MATDSGATPDAGHAEQVPLSRNVVHLDHAYTGVLIRPDWVLTSRNAMVDVNNHPRDVSLAHVPSDTHVVIPAANSTVHPDISIDFGLSHLDFRIETGRDRIDWFEGQDREVVGQRISYYRYGWEARMPLVHCGATGPACGPDEGCINTCMFISNMLHQDTLTVSSVVVGSSMNGSPLYSGKYLRVEPIVNDVAFDTGGPLFLNDRLVAISGGWPWRVYVKRIKNWADSIISPFALSSFDEHAPETLGDVFGGARLVADVDADGRSDVIAFENVPRGVGSQGVFVALAQASGTFAPFVRWADTFSALDVPAMGDVDGDGRSDLLTFDGVTGDVYVALSNGHLFGAREFWRSSFPAAGEIAKVGDMDGDGLADLVGFDQSSGAVRVELSCGTTPGIASSGCSSTHAFGDPRPWATNFSHPGDTPLVGDFNADSMVDLATITSAGDAFVALTAQFPCTVDAECPVACNITLGFCRDSHGVAAPERRLWGRNVSVMGETPMIADMNGDSLLDIASFGTGALHASISTGTSFRTTAEWANASCEAGQPAIGDLTRDGRDEALCFTGDGSVVTVGESH